ncbi:MAG: bifunctional glutamate N-acetyltransferase/amino-acid acetyltransferase ArgJ [Nitrospinae bacterium]|nr:bifunctional glutamate N-acetyltransferase/amino-acid acetyltransferase ArgJ [Nitrospinota bacterium]
MIPKGFLFSAVRAKFKNWDKEDLGLIYSETPCSAAAVFTTNRAKAAPVLLSMKHMASKTHRAVVANSGCANAGTGKPGYQNALNTARETAKRLSCRPGEVLVASTGVIGVNFSWEKLVGFIPELAASLKPQPAGFARSIMTTDTKPKSASASAIIGGKKTTVWGCAKGAGMIHPNMATMLAFLVTDAAAKKTLLQSSLREAVDGSFNKMTIDGDTSTNDTVFLLANAASGGAAIKGGTGDLKKFAKILAEVCGSLAEQVAADGEGVTRLADIFVEKAGSAAEARTVARAVAGSLLVKTALHGGDPNWGRIICAAGYSGVRVNQEKMELYFGKYCAYKNGTPTDVSEKTLAKEFLRKRVEMRLVLNMGKASASYLFTDISREYVTINSHYRT